MLSYELAYITTYDNVKYNLTDGNSRFVLSSPGEWGLPPIEYITQRAYKADYLQEIGYRLLERPFSISFRQKGCSRADYWNLRTALINALRPNRGGQASVTIRLATGELRSINVRSLSPTFPEVDSSRWDEYGFSEILQFVAYDPVFYNPAIETYNVINMPANQLAFPVSFGDDNFYFGGSSYGIAEINYLGNWYSYPAIRITAPFNQVTLAHIETGATVALTTGLNSGYMEFDFQNKTILDNHGNDYWNYLTPDSDLIQFRLEPDPIVPDGINEINFFLPGSGGATAITITYNERFIGI